MDKECRKCGEIKDIEKFPKRDKAKDGHHSYCQRCTSKGGTESNKRRAIEFKSLKEQINNIKDNNIVLEYKDIDRISYDGSYMVLYLTEESSIKALVKYSEMKRRENG